jgi:hypothetical protein
MYETICGGFSRFSRNRQDEQKFDRLMGYEPSDDELEIEDAEEAEIREFHREMYLESLREREIELAYEAYEREK